MYGTVIWFNPKRGYGFIKNDDGTGDVFCHWANIEGMGGQFKTLSAGQRVSFIMGTNHEGVQAEKVELLHEE